MRKLPLLLVSIGVFVLESIVLPIGAEATPRRSPKVKIIDSKCDAETFKTEGWHFPFPPYPSAARALREQGKLEVEIITGANGKVITASVAKSKGHPNLDAWAAKWAHEEWSGPPNHRITVPVTFILR